MYSTGGYHALRNSAAIVRRGDRGVLAVHGPDRLVWLQGLVTNDVAALGAGDTRYAAYLSPQGRMISDMRVVNLADGTLLEVPGVLAEPLRAKLDSLLFAEDAQVSDISSTTAVVDLHGPAAPEIADRVRLREDASAGQARQAWSASRPFDAIRDDPYNVPAVTFFTDRADVEPLVRALADAGAIETSLETLDVLRVEAGRPLFLVDMDEHTIPLEAGIEDRAISFSKGCYIGQEVIVRVLQRGQGRVAKKLVGLLPEKSALVKSGDAIGSGDREIGRVTSAVWSPTLERPIALGYVHRDFVSPGTIVDVMSMAGRTPATVTRLPFVPARDRPEGTAVKEPA